MSPAFAETPTNGELAAAVRSANYSCAHVIAVAASEDRIWRVQYNSGVFLVEELETGRYAVSSAN